MSEIDRLLYLSTRLIIPLLPTYRKSLIHNQQILPNEKKNLKNILKNQTHPPRKTTQNKHQPKKTSAKQTKEKKVKYK